MVQYFKFTLAIFNFNRLTLKLIEKIEFLYFSNSSSPISLKCDHGHTWEKNKFESFRKMHSFILQSMSGRFCKAQLSAIAIWLVASAWYCYFLTLFYENESDFYTVKEWEWNADCNQWFFFLFQAWTFYEFCGVWKKLYGFLVESQLYRK